LFQLLNSLFCNQPKGELQMKKFILAAALIAVSVLPQVASAIDNARQNNVMSKIIRAHGYSCDKVIVSFMPKYAKQKSDRFVTCASNDFMDSKNGDGSFDVTRPVAGQDYVVIPHQE